MRTLATAAFVDVFSTVSWYWTKSPIAATVVVVVFCTNNCVAAASSGTSTATAGGVSAANGAPNEPVLRRYGPPGVWPRSAMLNVDGNAWPTGGSTSSAIAAGRDQREAEHASGQRVDRAAAHP